MGRNERPRRAHDRQHGFRRQRPRQRIELIWIKAHSASTKIAIEQSAIGTTRVSWLKNVTRGIYRLEGILGEFRDFVFATQLHATESDINQILRNVTAESFPKHSNIDLSVESGAEPAADCRGRSETEARF